MSQVAVSIIICTCNRASDLRETLVAIGRTHVPDDLPCELLVVDNGSTDGTMLLVQECRLPNMPVRYVYEGRRGKGYAYNMGMATAQGQVLLFTDDDVRPPVDWVAGMVGPIMRGDSDAVAGGVRLAPHLERPWMETPHRSSLASTAHLTPDTIKDMVGANMAFAKHVLGKVPCFDPELGPGALGFADETLFSWQLTQAGYRLGSALDIVVEHHFDPSRLTRMSLLEMTRKLGRGLGYIAYHWQHEAVSRPYWRLARRSLRLLLLRLQNRGACSAQEGIPLWEFFLMVEIYQYRQYLIERKRPHNYQKDGLIKRSPHSITTKQPAAEVHRVQS